MDFLSTYQSLARGHVYHTNGDIGWFALSAFDETGLVRHGFSARTGGLSRGDYASLNLSFSRTGESHDTVRENYRLFAKAADFPYESMVTDTFEHGVTVRAVDSADKGRGMVTEPLPPCDGLVTNDPAVTLITGHADCLALYFHDPVSRCVGLAHAGWKGTLHAISRGMIAALSTHYKSKSENIRAGIGPCICKHCFEVDAALKHTFIEAYPGLPFYKEGKPGKAYIDLVMVTVKQFLDEGILPSHIALMDVCTVEEPQRLYSHRRDKGKTGGMAAFLGLAAPREAFLYKVTEAKSV